MTFIDVGRLAKFEGKHPCRNQFLIKLQAGDLHIHRKGVSRTTTYKQGIFSTQPQCCLTLSWRRPLSYRNQSIDLLRKSMDLFQYDNGLGHKRVNFFFSRASMLLRCCLMHITIIILKHILYWVYLCLGLDSFLSYLWFIFHFQSHFYCYQWYNLNKTVALIFVHCLEYLLFLDDNMDDERE